MPKKTNENPAPVETPKPDETPAPAETPSVPAPAEVTAVTADEIVAPLGERMPEVTAANPSAESSPGPATIPPPTPSAVPGEKILRDSRGVKFDAFRHQTNPDGTPRLNAKGNYMLKNEYRLGRIRRDGSTRQESSPDDAPTFAGEPANVQQDQYDLAAEVYLQAAYGPLQIAFGPDVKADADDHKALKVAVANYLRSTGATELSPGWALTITIAAFAAKKASVPTVQERALSIWDKIKSVFKRGKPAPVS